MNNDESFLANNEGLERIDLPKLENVGKHNKSFLSEMTELKPIYFEDKSAELFGEDTEEELEETRGRRK